jgi:hypothetical protein
MMKRNPDLLPSVQEVLNSDWLYECTDSEIEHWVRFGGVDDTESLALALAKSARKLRLIAQLVQEFQEYEPEFKLELIKLILAYELHDFWDIHRYYRKWRGENFNKPSTVDKKERKKESIIECILEDK